MLTKTKNYGLVVCGGLSSRMGQDKSLLVYHQKSQRYHTRDLLRNFCQETFISCNPSQELSIDKRYRTLVDLPRFSGTGPMAALLTAFTQFPHHNIFAIGCDYPFLTEKDLSAFSTACKSEPIAAAFYHEKSRLYEPLLAYYSHRSAHLLFQLFERGQHSLQSFLQQVGAAKYFPADERSMNSVDTPEAMTLTKEQQVMIHSH